MWRGFTGRHGVGSAGWLSRCVVARRVLVSVLSPSGLIARRIAGLSRSLAGSAPTAAARAAATRACLAVAPCLFFGLRARSQAGIGIGGDFGVGTSAVTPIATLFRSDMVWSALV